MQISLNVNRFDQHLLKRTIVCLVFVLNVATTAFAQDNSVCFIQITDPQFGMFENNEGFEKETYLYEKAVAEINLLQPDFVVITCDFVHDENSESQIDEFKRITSKINSEIANNSKIEYDEKAKIM